jgi:hypothetical protein
MIRQALELKRLTIDPDMNPRDGLKQEVITNYAEDMREGAVFPPLVVYNDGSALWLSEGFHRVYAAYQAGLTELEAEIRTGTKRDAWLNAIGSNATHGAQRTKGDTKKAIEMAFQYLIDEGRPLEGPNRITNVEVAEMAKVSKQYVGQVYDEVMEKLRIKVNSLHDQKIKRPPTQVDPTAEIDRLQKDLDKAVEMATAAEAKAAELYQAREKARREAEARAKAEKELQTFRAEVQEKQKEEIERRLEELKKNIKPEVREVEVQVPVEDPTTAFKLKKALEERERMEAELDRIKREQREMTRLEKDKVKLEAELKNLRMKARDEKAELTLYEAIDTIERVTFIRDRVHDLCNRNQLTISQLDKTETVLENLSIAIKEALVVVQASRGALTKEGGLKVVE